MHSVIIIDQNIDALRGNATSGVLTDLRAKVHAVDAALPTLSKPLKEQAEGVLENVQEWLTMNGTYNGATAEANAFITQLNAFL